MKKTNRQVVEATKYYHHFLSTCNAPSYKYDCDKDGNLIDTRPPNLKNRRPWDASVKLKKYASLVDDPNYLYRFEEKTYTWVEDATGVCDGCGAEMSFGSYTNTCRECGTDHGMDGWALAPRDQWGEETGETYSDIVGPGGSEIY